PTPGWKRPASRWSGSPARSWAPAAGGRGACPARSRATRSPARDQALGFRVGESQAVDERLGPMAETFFSMFTPEEIARISASGTHVTLPEGWAPISERTGADKAYVILEGKVSVR